MLKVYQEVFNKLNEKKIEYVVYKSLNHLNDDLNGNRGDIDVLVDENFLSDFESILISLGLKKTIKNGFPIYYFGYDKEKAKSIMLDIDIKIRLGYKPYRPYYYKIEVRQLKKKFYNGIWILDNIDYIPLMFFMRVTALSPKDNDLQELKELLLEDEELQQGYMSKNLENILNQDWEQIKQNILLAKNWNFLQEQYAKTIISHVNIDYKLLILEKTKQIQFLFRKIQNKLMRPIPYRIRKDGYLIAFIGVDGAGKSSTIEYILNMNYFKFTGIKRIYFGNNEYWIPGLLWGLKNINNNKVCNVFFALLTHMDKSLRSLIAYSYIKRGYIVVADRFYYDDFIGMELNKNKLKDTNSFLKKIYRKILAPRIWINPDCTIFLDVSPDVAYTRKQDYSYEIMLKVNKAYKTYMNTVENVIKIDADKEQKNVYTEVVASILALDE